MKRILQNRKTLYFVLSIVIFFVITISVVYAALNTVLKIIGNTEVIASNWDIHLNNVQVKNGSVGTSTPVITNKSTLSFDVVLSKPGDYYEFTVDVVNDGSIDAMIDSVVKTPTLSTEQSRYFLFEVSYANGEEISSNQILKKKTSTPIKVRVAYRRDLNASDLPKEKNELSLNITFIYVQSNGTGNIILNNGVSVLNVVSGDGKQVGDEICIDTECFYVISSDDEKVTLFSKYNLLVGYKYDGVNDLIELENPTGIQSKNANGVFVGYNENAPLIGVLGFSSTNYWSSTVKDSHEYIYNENSTLYEYVENYKKYIESLSVRVIDARLISFEELENLGCNDANFSCSDAPSWVVSSSYWTGSATNDLLSVWRIYSSISELFYTPYITKHHYGVRPVITISKSYF